MARDLVANTRCQANPSTFKELQNGKIVISLQDRGSAPGAVRVFLGTRRVSPLRGPVLVAGTLTLPAAVLIPGGWQGGLLPGILLGLDLLIWGMALFGLGWRLRSL